MKKQPSEIFYNTQHSPLGAFASFTLGAKGAKGGLAIELGKPADQNIFIGLEDKQGKTYSCLPFSEAVADESTRFDVSARGKKKRSVLRSFPDKMISRQLSPGRDEWTAGDLKFSIFSPACSAPDPDKASLESQRLAYVPSLVVELVVNNRRGPRARRAFFGYQGNDPTRCMRPLTAARGEKFSGIGCGATAIASNTPGVEVSLAFTPEDALAETIPFNQAWGLGTVGLLVGTVPPGVRKTFRFAVCFYRGGVVTTGMEGSYYYARFFKNIESVASWSLQNFSPLKARDKTLARRVEKSRLNPARRFMLAQAIHSYYGSTELLWIGKKPMWIVNEGEYRMINTFDLTADQVFFELELNPWTVANELDWFTQRYSYRDQVCFPKNSKKYSGGISFSHDMGVANHFSPPHQSVYEKAGLHGCFSHMTHEELVNWLMCALLYENKTGDRNWFKRNLPTFHACLESLLRRDHPDPTQRNGIMSLDSSRCQGGSEITTYDSLDTSLGQARHNLYLAVKCWGAYLGLEALFAKLSDKKRAACCQRQAALCAEAITHSADSQGLLPAVLFEDVPSRIIPAIEGLIIPHQLGLVRALSEKGPYGLFIKTLKTHLKGILKPGVCLFANGGWKLSSTSENSWLSKVYLCQHVAEKVLGLPADGTADQAHAGWLLDPRNLYWAWSDQIISGEAKGSKYYPRGVTSILWLEK